MPKVRDRMVTVGDICITAVAQRGPIKSWWGRALLFGQSSLDVQHKRVDVAAKLRNDERHALGHQVRNERDTARQTVQLRHRDRAFELLGPTQRCDELWAPFQGIRIFI